MANKNKPNKNLKKKIRKAPKIKTPKKNELMLKFEKIIKKEKSIPLKKISSMLKINEKKAESMAMKLSDSFTIIKQKPSSILKYLPPKEMVYTPNKVLKMIENLNLNFKALEGDISLRLNEIIKKLKSKDFEFNKSEIEQVLKEMAEISNDYLIKSKEYDEFKKATEGLEIEIKENSKQLNEKINDFYSKSKELASKMDSITKIKNKIIQKIIQLEGNFYEKNTKKQANDKSQDFKNKTSTNYPTQDYAALNPGFSTEIDELLRLAKKEKKITLKKLSKIYNENMQTIESWCEALEDKGFVTISYPLIGSPFIKYIQKEENK